MNITRTQHVLIIAFSCLLGVAIFLMAEPFGSSVSYANFNNYPTLQSPQGLANPTLAYGLEGITDWSASMPFLNLVKMGRPWIGHLEGQWGGVTYEELRAGGHLDAQGWPVTLPANVTRVGMYWDWSGPEYGIEEARAGSYVLTYEGDGEFTLPGATNVQTSPGRVTFDLSGEDLWALEITSTNAADHLRNFVVVRADRQALLEAGAIFNPDYLDIIGDARQVRFMDLMHTNNSTWEDWDDHTKVDYFTWANGAPVEVMVQLANEIQADSWFTMPFDATDSYITSFATYVRDNLDPDLVAYVELSNEVWNWAFQQAQDANTRGQAEFSTTEGAVWVNYYGKRAYETMQLWTAVYGAQAADRLVRVAAVQTGWEGLEQEILYAPLWEAADPSNYVAPHTAFDALAVTTYFGGATVSEADHRDALLAAINDVGVDDFAWHESQLRGELPALQGSTLETTFGNWEYFRTVANNLNLKLIAYEGGQHVHHAAFVDVPQAELDQLQTHMFAFIRSQNMADLYQSLWTEWMTVSDGPFMQFVDLGRPTQWGSWGLRASLSDTSPRAALLDTLNANTTPWWSETRGANTFRHGYTTVATEVNQELVGSSEIDYLVGNDSDNVFYPGPGDDGVNGVGATNTVLYTGTRSQYTVTPRGAGYVVTGPEGNDYLVHIQTLQFSDQAITPAGEVVDDGGAGAGDDEETDAGGDPDPEVPPTPPAVTERMLENDALGAGRYHHLRVSEGSAHVRSFSSMAASEVGEDAAYEYPMGLFAFELETDVGATETVTVVLDEAYDTSDWSYRKYIGDTFIDITDQVTLTTGDEDGELVTVIRYDITDGGALDADGAANGVIVDPAGPALLTSADETEESGGGSSGGGGGSRNSSVSDSTADTPVTTTIPTAPVTESAVEAPVTTSNLRRIQTNISYVQPSWNNEADVLALKRALNQLEGTNLPETGVYDQATWLAVQQFQNKYRREILDIWNLTAATGYVGITTRLKLNSMIDAQAVTCPAFTEYNGGLQGIMTSPEIGRTQAILEELDMYTGSITNVWDNATNQAMIRFQETFREVMLDPWNITAGTGYKYKTTNKFLNYVAGCDTPPVDLEGVGVWDF